LAEFPGADGKPRARKPLPFSTFSLPYSTFLYLIVASAEPYTAVEPIIRDQYAY
jgi:hypothetical protein